MSDPNRKNQNKHGIFINYKRSHMHLAGRIYDYFTHKGLDPFMDEHSLHQTKDFREDLEKEIANAPYFLCLLTRDGLNDLVAEDHEKNIYFQEIAAAFRHRSMIKVIIYNEKGQPPIDYNNLGDLPEEVAGLKNITAYELPDSSRMFFSFMDQFMENDIDVDLLIGIINWQEFISLNSNTLVLPRDVMDNKKASLEVRFGPELIESIKKKEPFTGENIIREINMACYAGSLIVAPGQNMIDHFAFDYGMMFNIFTTLLEDDAFKMSIITTAPMSFASKDAKKFDRLGNSALEDAEEAVFLGSFANIHKLMETGPYKKAVESKRFSFMLTECALPYAIFQIRYKEGYEQYNHIKIDLYSFGITSSTQRRSMIFFESDPNNKENYDFFKNQFLYLKRNSKQRSKALIQKNTNKWLKEWEALQEDI